jgi:selenocysteine lyase/cysteine desulfurase
VVARPGGPAYDARVNKLPPDLEVLGADLKITLADGRIVGYANLDYAATAPCLASVAAAVTELLPWYASVHRGAGAASRRCTREYEQARETIADFLDARPEDHLIFTRNTTDSLNLLAKAVPADTQVFGWDGEHHANLLPWASVHRLPVPAEAADTVPQLAEALAGASRGGSGGRPGSAHTPLLVAVTGASNVTGEIWPITELAEVAHAAGARIVVDAAQLAPHRTVSLARTGIDYLAMSGHKAYAPFGAGVLAGRADWLDAARPYLAGGGATLSVGDQLDVCWHSGPARHEAGTPNLLGAVALATACTALGSADRDAVERAERDLVAQLRAGLAPLPGVEELRMFGPGHDRVGIVAFAVAGMAASDVSAYLAAEHGIGVRDGLFCAHPLARRLLAEASERAGSPLGEYAVRASIGIGSTADHVDRLVTGVSELSQRQ